MSWLMPDVDEEQERFEGERGRRPEFGMPFVWCVEHDRPVSKCRQLAMEDYGRPFFDNCAWVTEAELREDTDDA